MASPGSVLIIVENLPVPLDRRVWQEALALRDFGHAVSVICPTGPLAPEAFEVLEGIHIYRHPLPPEHSSALGYIREYAHALVHEFRLARRVRRERGFDVVHICNPPDLLFLVALWHKFWHRATIIFDHHDLSPEMFEAKYGRRGFFYYALRAAEWLTFRAADIVISTNESYRDIAVRRGGKREDDVFVVRSGPNLERFQPVAPNPAFRAGRRYLVGYVGVMGEQDGVDNALQAVRAVVRDMRRSDIHFTFLGTGPQWKQLRRLAAELAIEEYVDFPGRVSDEELISRLSTADVCINPDPQNDFNDHSTMNKILEYMALGRPIVQFDLTEGRRSAADASDYAVPNDPADLGRRIVALIDDPDRRAAMAEAGRRRMVHHLEWRHQVPRLYAAYDRAFARRVTRAEGAQSA